MAEAFYNEISKGKGLAISAGTKPAKQINPAVVRVLRESGLDVSNQKPKLLTIEMLKEADVVITMGCNREEVCPLSFTPTVDWELPDPKGRSIEEVRRIRDEIENRVRGLLNKIEIQE
jgi:protein-tyrosine-phosphatase